MIKKEFLRTEQTEGKVFHSFEVDEKMVGIGLLANKNSIYIFFKKVMDLGQVLNYPMVLHMMKTNPSVM